MNLEKQYSQETALSQVRTLFDQWASSDRATQMALGHQPLMDAVLKAIAPSSSPSWAPSSSRALLDLGCGTGAFLSQAQAVGFAPTAGIDVSTKMLAAARENAPDAELYQGQFSDLPWPATTFDQVTTFEAIYYCLEPERALSEVARVLKPGGRFDLVIDYYAESSGTHSWSQGLGFEITLLSSEAWISLLGDAGLGAVSEQRILRPESMPPDDWSPSVWFPTQKDYEDYLREGALWITGWRD